MSLPKQVREAGEKAENMAEEMKMKGAPGKPAPKDPSKESGKKAAPKEDGKKIDPNDWHSRYVGIKQAYDREVPALRQQLAENQKELADLKGRLEASQAQAAKQTPASPQPDASAEKSLSERMLSVISEEERESFSPEFFSMIARMVSSAQSASANPSLEKEVEALKARNHAREIEQFWIDVNISVPDWETIQSSDEFQAWGKQYDPLLGMTRIEALVNSQKKLNSAKAIAVFQQFQKETMVRQPAQEADHDPALEQLSVPDGVGGGDVADSDGETFTQSEVEQFYLDVTKGAYKGREAEVSRIDRAIFEARKAGRIVPG